MTVKQEVENRLLAMDPGKNTKLNLVCNYCGATKPKHNTELLITGMIEGSCICESCINAAALLIISKTGESNGTLRTPETVPE